MNRDILIGIVMGLLGGFIIGYFTGTSRSSSQAPPAIAAAIPMPLSGAAPIGIPPDAGTIPNTTEAQARMFSNLQLVAREPKNLVAWTQLGNDYFDTHQPQKAVEAYAKALELEPNNPNVLTDQGIMYRQLMAYDKAIANFEKSSKLDPKHVQSLFNMGIVYSQDLKQNEKAIKAWNRVIEIAPTSQQAAQARAGIAELNSHLKIQ
ncbi:MAG: tetratricopeptide repeat protein [Holophagaceae bacterium]|nr:tetratricopeptide repeat protein [Holophagaceae bacterium]